MLIKTVMPQDIVEIALAIKNFNLLKISSLMFILSEVVGKQPEGILASN